MIGGNLKNEFGKRFAVSINNINTDDSGNIELPEATSDQPGLMSVEALKAINITTEGFETPPYTIRELNDEASIALHNIAEYLKKHNTNFNL